MSSEIHKFRGIQGSHCVKKYGWNKEYKKVTKHHVQLFRWAIPFWAFHVAAHWSSKNRWPHYVFGNGKWWKLWVLLWKTNSKVQVGKQRRGSNSRISKAHFKTILQLHRRSTLSQKIVFINPRKEKRLPNSFLSLLDLSGGWTTNQNVGGCQGK